MDYMRKIESSKEKTVFEVTNETGWARLTAYPVYPGIDLVYVDAHIQTFSSWRHPVIPGLFAINHCEEGRIECAFDNGKYLYMGQGDMSIGWRYNKEYRHSVFFPSSRYLGLSIMICVPQAQPVIDRLLGDDKSDLTELCNRFCENSSDFGLIMEENSDMKHLFYELYHVPKQIRRRYCQLKVLEILLFLSTIKTEEEKKRVYITKGQVELIKVVHEELTRDLQAKITIEDLAAAHHISPTMLKRCFKGVFGMAVGQYMKEYRIEEAKRQLLLTDDSILAIANKVGYENGSKFAVAFQKMTGVLPRDYRRIYRDNGSVRKGDGNG